MAAVWLSFGKWQQGITLRRDFADRMDDVCDEKNPLEGGGFAEG